MCDTERVREKKIEGKIKLKANPGRTNLSRLTSVGGTNDAIFLRTSRVQYGAINNAGTD